jgi:hypothetical protein
MKANRLALAILAASALGLVTQARADLITGSLWENTTLDATLANVPSSVPNVTFTANSIFFDSRLEVIDNISLDDSAYYKIGQWLNSTTGGATFLTGSGEAGNSMDNTFVKITGWVSASHGQTFTLEHDDGVTLIVGGLTVIDSAGPTSPKEESGIYTGTGGVVPFTLVYSEVAGAPAVLEAEDWSPTAGPNVVPDGGTTVALLGMALAGLAGWGRRVRGS